MFSNQIGRPSGFKIVLDSRNDFARLIQVDRTNRVVNRTVEISTGFERTDRLGFLGGSSQTFVSFF